MIKQIKNSIYSNKRAKVQKFIDIRKFICTFAEKVVILQPILRNNEKTNGNISH